ncbi:MAG: hypothetical protein A2W09_03825 [Deltaproteobacteria bacterium RBG_16_50_11]|nr:MAG: hypothetical protein A2W09_03825 [Deltaproteobacteria bacterium RBG_16_50_11]
MAYIIDQFMWGYQQFFQISLQHYAERLFEKIDPYLKPRIFLVGVLCKDLKNRHQICLEPEDCGYSQADFAKVNELASQLEVVDAETRIRHSHPVAQENHDRSIKLNARRDAIVKTIERDSQYDDILTYSSYPVEKDGYLVFIIMQIKKLAYESHYRLTKDKFNDRYNISTSLINSIIYEFLNLSSSELYVPDSGASMQFTKREGDELIRAAGKNFMYSIASKGNNIEGLHGLYEACNIISSLKYEGEEGVGGLIVAPKDHQNIKMTLILDTPIAISEYRKVRKFLELSDPIHYLISDSCYIFGLGQIVEHYNPIMEDLMVVRFTKHYHWEVSHADTCMMRVAYNQPHLPGTKLRREKLYSDVARIFSGIKKTDIDNLWTVINEAMKQKHGTMIVVSSGAEEEAKRLRNQSFNIVPEKLDMALVVKATSIDGSIIMSPDGVCHAIGAILDGIATAKGDSSRGARYNSAIRYYESSKNKYACFIIIVSEDGMVDIMPNLMPQIKRSSINEMIEKLNAFSQSKEELSIKTFNQMMEWLEQHKFYLSSEQCEQINKLRLDIEKIIERQSHSGFIRIVRNDLKPNPEMNDSYFVDKN